MPHTWLFCLFYPTIISAFYVRVADVNQSSNKLDSDTESLTKTFSPTEFPYHIDSGIPAYCNGSTSWILFGASQIVPKCRAADALLESSKIWLWGRSDYEFIPHGVQPSLEFPVMRTPLIVSSSKVPSEKSLGNSC